MPLSSALWIPTLNVSKSILAFLIACVWYLEFSFELMQHLTSELINSVNILHVFILYL